MVYAVSQCRLALEKVTDLQHVVYYRMVDNGLFYLERVIFFIVLTLVVKGLNEQEELHKSLLSHPFRKQDTNVLKSKGVNLYGLLCWGQDRRQETRYKESDRSTILFERRSPHPQSRSKCSSYLSLWIPGLTLWSGLTLLEWSVGEHCS